MKFGEMYSVYELRMGQIPRDPEKLVIGKPTSDSAARCLIPVIL